MRIPIEIGSALGLDHRPIIYRDWSDPRSDGVFGGFYWIVGGERDFPPIYGAPGR